MKFGLLEIGSTNTKAYLCIDGKVTDLGIKFIAFKTNYNKDKKLLESDIQTLYEYVGEVKQEVDEIHAFGTSIFRNITDQEKKDFTDRLKKDLDVDFRVVSADEESSYTVGGVINNIDYNGRMAVVIGGGGSTELAVINNKKIISKVNLDFGAIDITERFPELKDDTVAIDFNTIFNYTSSLVGNLNEKAEILVLAGGDYIYFYEQANYEMDRNHLYMDENQPYLLEFDKLNQYDMDILSRSLDEIKSRNADNIGWWDGARGMRFCMNAIARELESKYIIPTRINMLIGLADEIMKEVV